MVLCKRVFLLVYTYYCLHNIIVLDIIIFTIRMRECIFIIYKCPEISVSHTRDGFTLGSKTKETSILSDPLGRERFFGLEEFTLALGPGCDKMKCVSTQ